jgi:hypothetical protein
MSTPHQSPVDAYRLAVGPFLDGTPARADGELLRLALDARPAHLARLRCRWHAARVRRLNAVAVPTVALPIRDELAATLGPIQAEAAVKRAMPA